MYSRDWVYDEELDEGSDVDTRVQFLMAHLNEEVEEIEQGVTFRQMVRDCFPQGINKADIAIMDIITDRKLTPFLKEMDQSPPERDKEDDDPLVALEIYVAAEGNKWRKQKEHDLSIYLGIHGQGLKYDPESEDENMRFKYAISYSHWGTFACLPISFQPNTKLVLVEEGRKRQWPKFWGKKRRDYKYQQIDISYKPTLCEFLHDVFTDLCFCGSPENRDAHTEELKSRMDEIDNGTAKLVPFDIDEFLKDEED
jgi:hypothetical protein